jgi:hypothetical protein
MNMLKGWSTILGIGLAVLWFAGLNTLNATPWVTWLDGLGALCAWGIALAVSDTSPVGSRTGSTGALTIGLLALWVVTLFTPVPGWQVWWNFGFACAFGILAIACSYNGRAISGQVSTMPRNERNWFKRGA